VNPDKLNVSADEVRKRFHYDPDTGAFTRLVRGGTMPPGSRAGTVTKYGYLVVYMKGANYRVHRLAWLYVHGVWPKHQIDHINGDRLDNRLANLRDVPQDVNQQNRRTARRDSLTGLMGASMARGKYRAIIRTAGKCKTIGYFETAESAHAAYLAAKRRLHPGSTLA